MQLHWHSNPYFGNMARTISCRFKQLRVGLKKWSKELSQLKKIIHNCSWVLEILDALEDQRSLSIIERNFRKLVKIHMQQMLVAKWIYWKQRNTVRWMKFGDDENTMLFHAMATISFKRNFIASLTLSDDSVIFDHSLKAGALWSSFKERVGVSEFVGISYDLDNLISLAQLQGLDDPFTQEEINAAVKDMASDHAPGPDGFSECFMKKCWHIISGDFYKFCDDFFNGLVNLECINGSYIALVPKNDSPMSVNDYRPISLLNLSLKLLTKLLANRLRRVILSVIHANQYGFIKGRTIHDCLAWAFQFLHIFHHSKKEIVILHLDFEKAFDKVEHPVIFGNDEA